MFKDEIALIRFLAREFIAMFNVFFLFPLLIVLVLIGMKLNTLLLNNKFILYCNSSLFHFAVL